MDQNQKINELQQRLKKLIDQQKGFYEQVHKIQYQLEVLKKESNLHKKDVESHKTKDENVIAAEENISQKFPAKDKTKDAVLNKIPKQPQISKKPKRKSDLEKLIGESIINKIGIIVLIIGVGIGAKYSIENNLINPLTRIILGYLFGLGLIGVGLKLKKNYVNYSTVLVSGAMTILYFITFFAYDTYALIPQLLAFGLMLVFTVFTVLASLTYNKQIIAHIGLVGAYAVPFLLSDGSNRVVILFSYISIINIGILVLGFKRYWKSLFYSAYFLTWFIYALWYFTEYNSSSQFAASLIFLSIFFFIFYATLLAYKLIKKEQYQADDVLLLLFNSFIFYGIGYNILDTYASGISYLGLFTLLNALIHFGVSLVIYKQKLADRKLFLMIVGLVLVFITAAIPVQLNGKWVSLIWALEAALLFWIGRTQKAGIYELFSFILMILAFFSLLQDWVTDYNVFNFIENQKVVTPIFNVNFLISLIFVASFGLMTWLFFNKKYVSDVGKGLQSFASYLIPGLFILTTYLAFRIEIYSYWSQLYVESRALMRESGSLDYYTGNYDLKLYRSIWIINYSILFVGILGLFNIKKLKHRFFAKFNFVLILIALLIFLLQGLLVLSNLRESYIGQPSEFFVSSYYNIWIRYVSIAFVILLLVLSYFYKNQSFLNKDFSKTFDFVLHITSVWILSSELIHWLDIYDVGNNYKLGLSILWGVYSLFLIILGIWQRKKHLRIGAIVLFGSTLIKLFFYDISSLNTISKTVIFVSLGILLLIISFLYNKYKVKIFGDDEA